MLINYMWKNAGINIRKKCLFGLKVSLETSQCKIIIFNLSEAYSKLMHLKI